MALIRDSSLSGCPLGILPLHSTYHTPTHTLNDQCLSRPCSRSHQQSIPDAFIRDVQHCRCSLLKCQTACREHSQEQFSKYVNRYGPGMVIYWFGFIDDLQGSSPDLVLVDDFPSPEDTIQLPKLPLPPHIVAEMTS